MVSLPGHPAPVFPPNGEAHGAAVLCTGRKYNYSNILHSFKHTRVTALKEKLREKSYSSCIPVRCCLEFVKGLGE